jgi:hypothetical protein
VVGRFSPMVNDMGAMMRWFQTGRCVAKRGWDAGCLCGHHRQTKRFRVRESATEPSLDGETRHDSPPRRPPGPRRRSRLARPCPGLPRSQTTATRTHAAEKCQRGDEVRSIQLRIWIGTRVQAVSRSERPDRVMPRCQPAFPPRHRLSNLYTVSGGGPTHLEAASDKDGGRRED